MSEFEGIAKPGEVRNPTGKNGQTPITDAIRVLMTRPDTDKLDDGPINNAQRIALEWAKRAKAGELNAVISLTDRIEGKPPQAITGADGKDLIPETDSTELARRIAYLLSQAKT